MSNPVFQFLHSTYTKSSSGNGDAIVANLKNVETNESKLTIVRNPNRTIFIAKKDLWNTYNNKLESMPMHNLDQMIVPEVDTLDAIKKGLGYHSKKYVRRQLLLNDYRVFGADVPIEVLMKQHYTKQANNRTASIIKVGGLDIETSVLGGSEVILNTYVTHDHTCYTAILAPFLKDGAGIPEVEIATKKALTKFRDDLNKKAKKAYDQYEVTLNFKICKTEAEVITWIFECIHKEKDDFITMWNGLAFDIPYLLDRLAILGIDPAKVMCHPEVPKDIQVCNLIPDTTTPGQLTHWSHKWPFFQLSGYTQFIDAMLLYSRLRKVQGIESSYRLGDIAAQIIGGSKMELDDGGHHHNQENNFVEYTAYNVVDTIILPLMNKVTNDISSMLLLMEHSLLPFYSKQTKQLTHQFYDYCKENNAVPGSCMGSQAHETDKFITNTGGGVLSPNLAKETGVSRVKEIDDQTALHALVLDVDVSAEYPNMARSMNISRETKLSTALTIVDMDKDAVNRFFGLYTATDANAVKLGSEFFGLPDYTEMSNLIDSRKLK